MTEEQLEERLDEIAAEMLAAVALVIKQAKGSKEEHLEGLQHIQEKLEDAIEKIEEAIYADEDDDD